ncbi:MAG TPA: hypothetical protein VNA17_11675 [Pyrinomonadaceae bacterium]|nr:hypothetical protein [Pyrinomonadaceae bacterium]
MVLLLTVGLTYTAHAQKVREIPDTDSANILIVKKTRNLPKGNVAEKIEKDGYGNSRLAVSPDKVRRAFVLCVESGSKEVPLCVSRVFVTNMGTAATYEIAGEQPSIEANRPIDNLKWIDNNTLSYERWTGPYFGRRYVVDIKQMKQPEPSFCQINRQVMAHGGTPARRCEL